MINIYKNFKYKFSFIFAIAFSISSVFGLESFEEREPETMIGDKYFIYPSNVIEYSISGSSLIEFNLNSKGEVENLQIIESLGIPFDKSIIDGLSNYVSNEIVWINDNNRNQYRLEIKFEN